MKWNYPLGGQRLENYICNGHSQKNVDSVGVGVVENPKKSVSRPWQ